MQGIVDYFELSDYYQGLIDAIKNQIEHPGQTIAGRFR